MKKKKVVVIAEFHPKGLDLLKANDEYEVVVVKEPTADNISKAMVDADAVTIRTAQLTKEQLALAPNLKIVSRYGVGTDNIDVAYCSSKGIPVAVTVGGNDKSVAEHAFMLMISLAKDMKAGEQAVVDKNWKYRDSRRIHDLYGKTVLILGFGRIGQRLAKHCLSFDMNIIAYDPYLEKSPVDGVQLVKDYHDVLPQADFVSLHVPLTPETKDIIGVNELKVMKESAFLINTARGGLVNEDLLAQALKNGEIAGVGLDVFVQEPPDPTHPLFQHERSFFSLHTAGMSEECTANLGVMTVQRIFDCFENKLDPKFIFNRKNLNL